MAGGPSAYFTFWEDFDDRVPVRRAGGPRLDLLDEMTVAQRRRTERELLHRLRMAPDDDGWVLVTLGALGTIEAVPALRGLVHGALAEDAAIALWRISRWRGAVRVLRRVVTAERGRDERRDPSIGRRIDAARYLAEIGSPRATATLREAAAAATAPYRLQRAITALL